MFIGFSFSVRARHTQSLHLETFVKTWRFVTLMLLAVALSGAFAHLGELPGNLTLDGPVKLHRTLYTYFGHVAGWAEFAALVSAIGLAWALRKRGRAFAYTLVAAVCQAAAIAIFFIFVQPANRTMLGWSVDAIPDDWTVWRDWWEYGHAARAVLEAIALGALVWSVVRETSSERSTREPLRSSAGSRAANYIMQAGETALICETEADGLRVVYGGGKDERTKKP